MHGSQHRYLDLGDSRGEPRCLRGAPSRASFESRSPNANGVCAAVDGSRSTKACTASPACRRPGAETSSRPAGQAGFERWRRTDLRRHSGNSQVSGETLAEVTCPRWRRARHDGLLVHETTALSDRDMTAVDGIPVTTIERTILDLAAVCSSFTVDLAIDSAIRRQLTNVDKLCAMLRRVGKRGRKGTKTLRRLLADRDSQYTPTESEREQMLLPRPARARPT